MDILELTRHRVDTIEERARRNEMTALHVFQSMHSLIDGLITERDQLMAQHSQEVSVPDEYLLAQLELVSRSLKNKDLSVMSNAVNKAIAIIQSPRITEQDVHAIVSSAMHHYIFNDQNTDINEWMSAEGHTLLNKLNTKNGDE